MKIRTYCVLHLKKQIGFVVWEAEAPVTQTSNFGSNYQLKNHLRLTQFLIEHMCILNYNITY
jgi:hypothetical protein